MRKIFQDDWHGILFKDITVPSSKVLAGPEFYRNFYKYLSAKYNGWSELEPEWVGLKIATANLLESRFPAQKSIKILSISCGLGVIEKKIFEDGYDKIDITESADEPLAWIKKHLPRENIFTGIFPDCVPDNRSYGVIFLAGAEYFLNRDELVLLLKKIKGRLSEDGKCILVSWSFEPDGILNKAVALFKDAVKYTAHILHFKDRGQFWGYSRNRSDFHDAMIAAGFCDIEDGLLKKETRWDTYWIDGKKAESA